MALDELLGALERDTAVELAAIAATGDAEAAQIDAEAARARDERLAAVAAEHAAARRAAVERDLAEAARRARADVLAARARMLERLRAQVDAELPARLDDRVGSCLVAAALACVGDDTGTLRCAPTLVERARGGAPPGIRVTGDPAVATGAIVELSTGTRIDATLVALLEREWPRLACEALALERAR